MCRQCDAQRAVGNWVQFRTQWGAHRGIVEQVNPRAVLVRVPRQYAPAGLATGVQSGQTDEEKLDLVLAYGYGRYGAGYGRRWGYPGYGAWGGGWWWWWLAFAWIFALAFLW